MKKINIGIIGFGTIGSGLVKALKSKRALLKEKTGIDITISRICDKDLKTKRSVRVDKKMLTKSIGKVLYDSKIDIVWSLSEGCIPQRI